MTISHQLTAEGILLIGLNRPEKLNALDEQSKIRLGEVWDYARTEDNVRTIVIYGEGERAFCAGSDLKEAQEKGRTVTTDILARSLPGVLQPLNKPVIAALHGYTLGLGISLAIHCDYRIAHPDTRFSFPEIHHGMLSGFSAITLPLLVGESRALDLMLTGRKFTAQQSLDWGLVNALSEQPRESAIELARQLSTDKVAQAAGWTKHLILSERRRQLDLYFSEIDKARLLVTKQSVSHE
ncbi:enoyl-CoA hydratase/isomerase family protein [Tatumella citrea]|uniref:Hydratase n=1 Tax=Tatumella citrea TaxID=53336 RepID=A0A1Y0L5L5_TATCI|nr:enoyl-CoA hydratase/isomerase family protein [Tatumella citrea]ARU93035.1 hydratase [Tatumella citrea]ARU97073.1 hydratase [Tatumella citrea]